MDRLWIVAEGTVKPFEGDLDEYARFVLSRTSNAASRKPSERAPAPEAPPAEKRRSSSALRKDMAAAEARMEKFHDLLGRVDAALATTGGSAASTAAARDLAQKRAELERALIAAEEEWLRFSAEVEGAD